MRPNSTLPGLSPRSRTPKRQSTRHGQRIVAFALLVVLLALLGSAAAAAATPFIMRVPVLMYHRITAPGPHETYPDLWIPPSLFRRQLGELKDNGWIAVTAEELAQKFEAREAFGPKRFVISIDDGAIDGYTNVFPILTRLDMRGTFFVNPGHVGRKTKMDWDQLREMRTAGQDIANHSLTHADLPTLSASQLRRQVEGAERRFEAELGYRPLTFCYPYGHYDAAVRAQVEASGFHLAFTTAYGAKESSREPFQAPRIRIHPTDSPSEVLAKLAPYQSGR